MSRRAAVIEEEFDDDTDLPLPVNTIPNTGARGALLEAISDDEGDSEPGPATPSSASFARETASAAGGGLRPGSGPHINQVTDITPYKKWICVYPIYIDAKRAYGTGQRRVPREKSVWWPLSRDMAEAAGRLGFGTLHEAQKFHPRDWENPGRVRVQLKKDGKLVNPRIRNKKELLEFISLQIQLAKPDNVPRPPYITSSSNVSQPPSEPTPAPTPTPAKGKQPASKTAGKGATSGTTVAPSSVIATKKLPAPPAPLPPLASRVSPFSPALVSGVLVDTVKAGMNAPDPISGGLGGGGGKGKRKVVRVRQ
ncbi:signal recognition particle, SRP19 subunit [Irpex rosettiformis]|uniref:Signal recognition particle, SRP19 subunit n=1 Tax=Irpex rosettiformis TaxID=378272 RepID=A0ACB8U3V5_9APHY|nr:signal recognition particle, SRP19 subunit [Irpex rosettiformis]